MPAVTSPAVVFERVAAAAAVHLRSDRRLRRNLPGGGRLHLDRSLPFLVVYRRPPDHLDEGTAALATAPAAYLVASGDARFQDGLGRVVESVAAAARARRGAFLLVELWAGPERRGDAVSAAPATVTVVSGPASHEAAAARLVASLRELVLSPENDGDLGVPERLEGVELRAESTPAPPGLPPLLEAAPGRGLFRMGVEVSPFYRDGATGAAFPRVVQALRRALAQALEQALFIYAQEETSLDPPHPRALARTSAEAAATHVDRRLGEVYGALDTLLLVTPVNSEEAWREFQGSGFARAPTFRYRPLPFDPEHLKRRLFHVPIERVEAPLLGYLFREKQEELDREITMLRDLETPRFLQASAALHGTPDESLTELAREVLRRLPPPRALGEEEEYADAEKAEARRRQFVDAQGFALAAMEEIDRYRRVAPAFHAAVEIRPDVAAGLIVSKGVLCVGADLHVPRERVPALLSHEVGTHLVTYCNGQAQPLRLFAAGLAGYDPLQEGIAVLAEYLVGGLTVARARVLAGRVLAVRSLLDGAGFVDTFRLLNQELGFDARTAFVITLRVHRGGGLTKDAVYLKGLRDLLTHLRGGGTLEPLLVGKVGLGHADVVQELVLTGVLRLPVVRPLYTTDLAAMERLGACRHMDILDLIETVRP